MNYLVDVGISVFPKLALILGIWLLLQIAILQIESATIDMIKKDYSLQFKNAKRIINVIATILIFAVIWSGATASSNTWKNETFDRVQSAKIIEQRNLVKEPVVIEDRTKKPELTSEDRAQRFSEITKY